MPPRNRRRRGRRPNVFVQTDQPTGRRESESAATPSVEAASPILTTTAAVTERQRSSPRRTQRTRSEVYARTFPLEIRKMGILAVGIAIALTVFTVVL